MSNSRLEIVPDDTCFSAHARHGIECPRTHCRHWIDDPSMLNCSIIGAGRGGMTLEQIGQIFGLTRMRVCQIEKGIYDRIIDQLTVT